MTGYCLSTTSNPKVGRNSTNGKSLLIECEMRQHAKKDNKCRPKGQLEHYVLSCVSAGAVRQSLTGIERGELP